MDSFQPDPFIPFAGARTITLRKAWSLVFTHARPRRLIREDEGVRGPLWFCSNPSVGALHVVVNVLRIIFALLTAPAWMWFRPWTEAMFKRLFRAIVWDREWPQAPEAILLSGNEGQVVKYDVSAREPRWLLEVEFRGGEVVMKKQVRYDDVRRWIRDVGYTAIAYPIKSAEHIFRQSGARLDAQLGAKPREYSLANRKRMAGVILDEYAKARTAVVKGKTDGIEYLWLDEFCLADETLKNEVQILKEREMELGRVADTFRSASRVVVFCHVVNCDHTNSECPWRCRLLSLAEIVYTSKVFRLKRTNDTDNGESDTILVPISGNDFRSEIQARAAQEELWHLHNIMQHANNTSGVTWQSAIHSFILEALRLIEEDDSVPHNLLGKALNGLFPRSASLQDLHGINGWADLLLLLELNQGFYNAAMLASVCRLEDPDINGYRWWGKPITPSAGSERLEPLCTGIPVRFHNEPTGTTVPALSLLNTKAVALDHMLQRDSGALERQAEMASLRFWARFAWGFLVLLGFILSSAVGGIGGIMFYVASILYVILQLIVGTIYVTKDSWVVIEDCRAPGADPFRFLQTQDPSYTYGIEWGPKQLVPRWEVRHLMEPRMPSETAHPYPVTLIDLSTGLLVKAFVTSRPNNMAILSIHGNGVTCMLLDRNLKTSMASICVKVGMASLPPYLPVQAVPARSLYIGGNTFRTMIPSVSFWQWVRNTISGEALEDPKGYLNRGSNGRTAKEEEDLEMQFVERGPDLGPPLAQTTSITSTAPILHKGSPYRNDTNSSGATITADGQDFGKSESDLGNGPVPPLPNGRYRELPNIKWFPERRGAEIV